MIRNVRLLYIHNFLVDFRFQEAFLPIYFAQITGSYASGMAVFAASTLTSAAMDIPTGILSDRMGRKITLVLSSLFLAAGIACYALAHGLLLLFAGGMLCGLSECMFNGNNNALLYESLKSAGQHERFSHYQSRAGSMFQIGLGLSGLCASFFLGHGLRFVFALGVVPQLLGIVVAFMFTEPRQHEIRHKESLGHLRVCCLKIRHNPRLLLFIMAQAFSYADEALFKFQTAYFNLLWPTWALGIYRAVNHLLGFTGFWLAARVLDRFRNFPVLIFRGGYWLFSQTVGLMLGNITTPLIFLSGALFYGPGQVARDHLLQQEFTDEQRATMGSIASFACSILFAITALGIGVVSDRFGLKAGIALGVAISAISIPLYCRLFNNEGKI
jgi:MFS family permease